MAGIPFPFNLDGNCDGRYTGSPAAALQYRALFSSQAFKFNNFYLNERAAAFKQDVQRIGLPAASAI